MRASIRCHRQGLGQTSHLNCNIFLALASVKREIKFVMRKPQRAAPKKFDYPAETPGSRLATKARKLASKLTPEEEAEHFRRGMAIIYGSQPKEITGAGH
jgi:hypothetical protein